MSERVEYYDGDSIRIRVGDVWADNDARFPGRHLRVLSVPESYGPGVVECEVIRNDHAPDTVGRRTRISAHRFRPTSTGYRLVTRASLPTPNTEG